MSLCKALLLSRLLPSVPALGLALGSVVAALATSSLNHLAAQGSFCPDPPYHEAWVDPVNGQDPGVVNNPTFPFRTLNAAIVAVRGFLVVSPGFHGLVHALPGIYSNGTNNEVFPIEMLPLVHVQGAGAKQCVIRGDGANANVNVYWPLASGPVMALREVLVDYSNSSVGLSDSVEEMFDGFTLQGGDVQVRVWGEGHLFGRISNCIFDLRQENSVDIFHSPSFGILMVAVWFGDLIPTGYGELDFNVFNNTFIQGWRRGDGVLETAIPSNVAICDVNDPIPISILGKSSDPDLTVRGVSDPSIQNCVIRSLPGFPRTALLGIDSADTTTAFGTAPGPTDAFDSTLVGGTNGTFASAIVGSPPVPKVDLFPGGPSFEDPAWVGEMIGDTQSLNVRDWRLLPDSILVDQGTSPLPFGSCELLVASNLTFYLAEPFSALLPASPFSSFDWDGEGHANPRRNGEVDIGYDETDLFVVAGCYGNDSNSHNNPWDVTIPQGIPTRTMIFPSAGSAQVFATLFPYLPGFFPAWTIPPGTIDPGISFGALGTGWLDLGLLLNSAFTVSPATFVWLNPIDAATHVFGQDQIIYDEGTQAPVYLNEQGVFAPAGGGPLRTTNVQSEYF